MEAGLTTSQAQKNLQTFGRNEIVTQEGSSLFALFYSQFASVINGILSLAAFFSFVIKNSIDGIFILTILILNAVFGFIQEYKAEKSLAKLKSFIRPLSRVIRDKKEQEVSTFELVPNDLVILSEGDRIPADGNLVLSKHLEIDESILTGESLPVIKREGDTVFSGTLSIKGRGYLLIEKTGMNTRFGQIAKTLSTLKTEKTPLQKQLDHLGKFLSLVAVIAALLLIPIGVSQGKVLFPLILLAVSLAIAAIPEGLPAVITISLAIGTNRMAKKNAIIRKMQAIETLGSVQIILTDKTGTLTQNTMRVKKTWVLADSLLPFLVRACVLGNTSSLIQRGQENQFDVLGDKTDGALLLWAKEQISDLEKIKNEGKVIDEYAFDPVTRTITTVWGEDHRKYVFVRGAPEEILKRSKNTKAQKEKVLEKIETFAKEGLRVIGFGKKIKKGDENDKNNLEKNLEFIGLVGIYDPPREEAKKSLEEAKKAGIKTIMVTGDNKITALTIAKEIGLIEKDEDVISGEELEKLTDDQLEKIIDKTRIFARVKPEDKLRLTHFFKKKGFVVGVTGDGVNDALALKSADVGIAMGETGTDVAKEASDIVLADDNFSTIVHAVEEGRTIYNNILKAITYLVSGNLSELSLVFFATILNMPSPLLPTQILWINLITDGLPALALASDTKNADVLKLSPRNPNVPILNAKRIVFVSIIGFGLSFFLLVVFKIFLASNTEILARTITFNLLIILHLMITFVVRGGLFPLNRFLIIAVLGTLGLQILITFTPFFQNIFHLGF